MIIVMMTMKNKKTTMNFIDYIKSRLNKNFYKLSMTFIKNFIYKSSKYFVNFYKTFVKIN
jgi:hypothetical protein